MSHHKHSDFHKKPCDRKCDKKCEPCKEDFKLCHHNFCETDFRHFHECAKDFKDGCGPKLIEDPCVCEHIGQPKFNPCGLLVITEYDYPGLGPIRNDLIPVGIFSSQRNDRVLHDVTYNMTLFILGDIITRLSQAVNPMAPPHPYTFLTKDSLLRIPNLELTVSTAGNLTPSTTAFTSRFEPTNLVETWLRKIEADVGDAREIPGLTDPLPPDQQLGQQVDPIVYCDHSDDPLYVALNQSLVGSRRYSPDLVVGSLREIFEQLSVFGFDPNNPLILAFLAEITALLTSPKVRDEVNNNTDCKSGRIVVNETANVFFTATHAFGPSFTPFCFPECYAIQLQGGDFATSNWRINNDHREKLDAVVGPGRDPVYRTRYFVDKNLKELFQFLTQIIDVLRAVLPPPLQPVIPPPNVYLPPIFAMFKLNPCHVPKKYIPLYSTWAGSADCYLEQITIPKGLSTNYGRPTRFTVDGQLIYAVGEIGNHGKEIELRFEAEGKVKSLVTLRPCDDPCYCFPHMSAESRGDYGAENGGYPFHFHPKSKTAHIPFGGLIKCGTYSPAEKGPILKDPVGYILRSVSQYNNPHCKIINNSSIVFTFWSNVSGCPLPENPDQQVFFITLLPEEGEEEGEGGEVAV